MVFSIPALGGCKPRPNPRRVSRPDRLRRWTLLVEPLEERTLLASLELLSGGLAGEVRSPGSALWATPGSTSARTSELYRPAPTFPPATIIVKSAGSLVIQNLSVTAMANLDLRESPMFPSYTGFYSSVAGTVSSPGGTSYGTPVTHRIVPGTDQVAGDGVRVESTFRFTAMNTIGTGPNDNDRPVQISYSASYGLNGQSANVFDSSVFLHSPNNDQASDTRNVTSLVRIGVTDTVEVGLFVSGDSLSGGGFTAEVRAGYFVIQAPDLRPLDAQWDRQLGEVRYRYESTSPLPRPDDFRDGASIAFYWASGPTLQDRIAEAASRRVIQGPIPAGEYVGSLPLAGPPPMGATHLLMVIDPENSVIEGYEGNNLLPISIPQPIPEIAPTLLALNPDFERVDFGYEISAADLPCATSVALFWASGESLENRLQEAHSVAAATAVGSYGPITVPITALGMPPAGTTHLMLHTDPDDEIAELDEENNIIAIPWGDSDFDGLLDDWEINGIDVNRDGVIDLDLPALGADPRHKDLFVEVDAMAGRAPSVATLGRVVVAFNRAPNQLVGNPDGRDGVSLRILLDETGLPFAENWPNGFAHFDVVKRDHFGTPNERADPNWANIRAARALAYRYCVFANTHSGGSSSGLGELWGNDFMVTLGGRGWTPAGGTPDQQAGTFMHELGHTLGLHHGGADAIGYKPNYHSVMNYLWQVPSQRYPESWILDFSREDLPEINEAALNESAGIGGDSRFRVPAGPAPSRLVNERGSIDFNRNGQIDTFDPADPIAVDINYVLDLNRDLSPSPGQLLRGHEDWSALQYRFGNTPNFADGVHVGPPGNEELTFEVFQRLNAIGADSTTRMIAGADAGGGPHVRVLNGITGAEDLGFLAYDASFAGGVRVATGDISGDGTPDIITAPGTGGGPHVRVFDGVTGQQLLGTVGSFFAYGLGFTGGVFVAAGDVNGDGRDDVITAAGAGGGPHVRVLSGVDGTQLHSFFAYGAGFSGGVTVAAGDVNADGKADIITGPGPGGGPHVRVFSGVDLTDSAGFSPTAPTFLEAFSWRAATSTRTERPTSSPALAPAADRTCAPSAGQIIRCCTASLSTRRSSLAASAWPRGASMATPMPIL